MTITVIYETGNGYSCSCCRNTDQDNDDFESERDAIEGCVDIARRYKWDFSIERIIGVEDGDGLERRIDAAIEEAKKQAKIDDAIYRLERENSTDRAWIDSVPTEVERRQKSIAERNERLKELKGAIAQ
jgi:hypothetical protein